ncbi:MAG: lactonase family protein [Planctomycetota bacterium]
MLAKTSTGDARARAGRTFRLLIGSYSEALPHAAGDGPGVIVARLSPSGLLEAEPDAAALPVRNASYLSPWVRRRDGKGWCCYAVNEVGSDLSVTTADSGSTGVENGGVTVLGLPNMHAPSVVLGQARTGGAGPAYASVTPDGRWLLVANYVGGNASALPIRDDGSIAEPVAVFEHDGAGPITARQERPHPHAALTDPAGRWWYVVDLGIDAVVGYSFQDGKGKRDDAATLTLPPGSGPRHLIFASSAGQTTNPNLAYLNLELSGEVAALRHHPQNGAWEMIQRIPARAETGSTHESIQPSELALTRDERWLVLANRVCDVVSLFACDPKSGRLAPVADFPTGRTPRHLAWSPDDRFLVVAEQDEGRVTVYEFDREGGALIKHEQKLAVGSPCFVRFYPA